MPSKNAFVDPTYGMLKNRIAISFNLGYVWKDGIDNTLLDLHRCSTKVLASNRKVGIYGRNSTSEITAFPVNYAYISSQTGEAK